MFRLIKKLITFIGKNLKDYDEVNYGQYEISKEIDERMIDPAFSFEPTNIHYDQFQISKNIGEEN